MASARPKSSIIQFDESPETNPELQFEDFGHSDAPAATLETSKEYASFPSSPDLGDEKAELLSEEKKGSSVWEFSYYQSFFDVNTDQVIQRIFGYLNILRLFPFTGTSTFLDRLVRPTPDLYGPFWISTTLIFSTAISGNIAAYFLTEGQDDKIWHFDFHKVSLAATAIYSYAFLVPLAFWCLLWYRKSTAQYTLLEIICVYGYSLFIYVPLSILWLVQVPWLHIILISIAAIMSGVVLVHTFLPAMREWSVKLTALVTCIIVLLHILLAVGLVAYFFQTPHWQTMPIHVQTSPVTTVPPAVTTEITKPDEKMQKNARESHNNVNGVSESKNLSVEDKHIKRTTILKSIDGSEAKPISLDTVLTSSSASEISQNAFSVKSNAAA